MFETRYSIFFLSLSPSGTFLLNSLAKHAHFVTFIFIQFILKEKHGLTPSELTISWFRFHFLLCPFRCMGSCFNFHFLYSQFPFLHIFIRISCFYFSIFLFIHLFSLLSVLASYLCIVFFSHFICTRSHFYRNLHSIYTCIFYLIWNTSHFHACFHAHLKLTVLFTHLFSPRFPILSKVSRWQMFSVLFQLTSYPHGCFHSPPEFASGWHAHEPRQTTNHNLANCILALWLAGGAWRPWRGTCCRGSWRAASSRWLAEDPRRLNFSPN